MNDEKCSTIKEEWKKEKYLVITTSDNDNDGWWFVVDANSFAKMLFVRINRTNGMKIIQGKEILNRNIKCSNRKTDIKMSFFFVTLYCPLPFYHIIIEAIFFSNFIQSLSQVKICFNSLSWSVKFSLSLQILLYSNWLFASQIEYKCQLFPFKIQMRY